MLVVKSCHLTPGQSHHKSKTAATLSMCWTLKQDPSEVRTKYKCKAGEFPGHSVCKMTESQSVAKLGEKFACDEKVDSKDLGICEIHIHFCLHKSTNCPIYYLMGFLGPQEGICASRLYACIDGTSWYLSGGWLVGHTTGCAAAVKHMHGGPVTFSHHESFAVAQQSFGTTTVTASKEGNWGEWLEQPTELRWKWGL